MNYSPKVLDSANSKNYGKLQDKALEMRNNPTKAEAKMWEVLRRKNLGVKFRQQHVMNQFIVDFYCIEKSLIIEIDGSVHDLQKDRDEERTQILESLGCSFLRFTNEEVLGNIERGVEEIRNYLKC